VDSRVHFPSERTCPPEVLRGCRAVDPSAELLYAGGGRWILGAVRFSWLAYKQAWNAIDKLYANVTKLPYQNGTAEETLAELTARGRANAQKLAFNQLALQGYRHIAIYDQNDPDWRIVKDFEYRDFELRVFADLGLDLVLAAALAEGDQDKLARIEKLRSAIRLHGTSAWRYATRMLSGYRPSPSQTGAAA
jgi:hypothetical protein